MGIVGRLQKILLGSHKTIEPSPLRAGKGLGVSEVKSFETLFENLSHLGVLYDYANWSDIYRTIIQVNIREAFRNGGAWQFDFVSKCTNENCETEYESEMEKCELCGSRTRKPDITKRRLFEPFIKQVNANNQTLIELAESTREDSMVINNIYMVCLKEYTYNNDGEIIGGKVKEYVRGDPLFLRKIIDQFGRKGYEYFTNREVKVCPEHRSFRQEGERCSQKGCIKKLYPAHYRTGNVEKTVYYLPGEIYWGSEYSKTIWYGYPMALTVLTNVRTLMGMGTYERDYYQGKKTPKGILIIRSTNSHSAEQKWDQMVDEVEKDPHAIKPIFIPSSGAGETDKFAEYIDFSRSLDEMQYTESKNMITNRIGAPFGCSPIFTGDLSTSGGLNQEGLQITITTRATEVTQAFINRMVKWMSDQVGVEDSSWKLNPPEEKDEMAEIQRESLAIQNAQLMQSMGFSVERTPDGKFKHPDKPEERPQPELAPDTEGEDMSGRADGTPDKPTN